MRRRRHRTERSGEAGAREWRGLRRSRKLGVRRVDRHRLSLGVTKFQSHCEHLVYADTLQYSREANSKGSGSSRTGRWRCSSTGNGVRSWCSTRSRAVGERSTRSGRGRPPHPIVSSGDGKQRAPPLPPEGVYWYGRFYDSRQPTIPARHSNRFFSVVLWLLCCTRQLCLTHYFGSTLSTTPSVICFHSKRWGGGVLSSPTLATE